MSRFSAWFRGSAPKLSDDPSLQAAQAELRAQATALLNDAISGADLIMNDDVDGAEERLKQGSSTYHSFGLAVCAFMKSILGFERTFMTEASTLLAKSETSAWNEIKKAEKEASSSSSQPERVYPPGSEYQLVLAESYLMAAIIGVLHESLTEGIKSFYKLRKAYIALDNIIQAENAYLKKRGLQPTPSRDTTNHVHETMPGGFFDDAELESLDADESRSGDQPPETTETLRDLPPRSAFQDGPDSDIFADPVDAFVHS